MVGHSADHTSAEWLLSSPDLIPGPSNRLPVPAALVFVASFSLVVVCAGARDSVRITLLGGHTKQCGVASVRPLGSLALVTHRLSQATVVRERESGGRQHSLSLSGALVKQKSGELAGSTTRGILRRILCTEFGRKEHLCFVRASLCSLCARKNEIKSSAGPLLLFLYSLSIGRIISRSLNLSLACTLTIIKHNKCNYYRL